jgi:cyclopropane fatty-acyl-phospholipid synthase-like methyltransferase
VTGPDPNIKSMGLYRNVERILADLEHAGLVGDAPLRVDDLVPYDQYHYEGTNAVDAAADQLAVRSDDHVLDVGSGLGGPARYLADRTGCRVAALELQPDLHTIAGDLTARCGLEGRVEHLVGDILAGAAGPGRFDGLMSMLCFLHISDRPKLFDSCREVLRPGALMYIEDYFARGDLEPAERVELSNHLFCDYLPDLETYKSHMLAAGFTVENAIDMTSPWTEFVVARLRGFRENRDHLLKVHGTETVDSLDVFYATVVGLFRGGRLGGVRFLARLDSAP